MMKRILVAGAAMAALASFTTASATTPTPGTQGTLQISGVVNATCGFGSDSAVFNTSIALGNIVGSNGKLDATKFANKSDQSNVKFWCNSPGATYSVVTHDLIGSNGTGNNADFSNDVAFQVTTNLPGGSTPGATQNGVLGLWNNYINVLLANPSVSGDKLLVAGNYAGSVVVTVSPGV